MRRILALLLLLAAPLAWCADGDYVGAQIDSQGWKLLTEWSAMDTNGTFAFGFGTNRSISGSEKVKLSVMSPGYNDVGESIAVTRLLYGMEKIRFTFNSNAYPNVVSNDVSTTIQTSLSDYVFAGDTNLYLTNLLGAYVAGGVNSAAATGMPVTNNSAMTHQRVIANWSWPPNCYRVTSSTADLRVVAYHASGQSGRPVRVVAFWGVDEDGNRTPTNWVTQATIKRDLPDAVPVVEYCTLLDISGCTANKHVTNYFAAYPWVGDSGSVLRCDDGVYPQPGPLYSPRVILNDRSGTYGDAYCTVDPAGNNATAEVMREFTNASKPFVTIGAAAAAIAASNNTWYSRNDVGGGHMYLTNGAHNWKGASGTFGSRPKTHLIISPFPGTNRADVSVASAATSSGDITDVIKFENLTVAPANNATTYFSAIDHFWWNNCRLESGTSGSCMANCTNWVVSFCSVTNWRFGFGPFGGDANTCSLMRGNTISTDQRGIWPFVCIGNYRSGTNQMVNPQDAAAYIRIGTAVVGGKAAPVNDGGILAYNIFYGLTQVAAATPTSGFDIVGALSGSNNFSHGFAMIQNIFESCRDTDGTVTQIGYGDPPGGFGHNTNTLIWNCTFLGGKGCMFYNDSGSIPIWTVGASVKNCFYDDWNIKSDTHTDPAGDPARIGNWSALYGVGWGGNVFWESENIGAPGDFTNMVAGVSAIQNGIETSSAAVQFIAPNQYNYNGSVLDTAGSGNYRYATTSVVQGMQTQWVLPYDIEGNARGLSDPCGAYCSANPKRAAGFF